ncbi:Nose resistant to fluoxetine protein 6, partial [Stegodyphus mimosarum]
MSAKFVKNVLPYALRASENLNLSSKCTRGLMAMLNGIKQTKTWAYRMIDASGKIPNGVLSGNINSLGDYEECLNVDVPNNFRGQYCPVKFLAPVPERRPFTSADDELPEFVNATKYGLVVGEFMKKAYYYHYLSFRSSVCVPSTCSAEEVQRIAEKVMEMSGIEFDVNVPHCESKEEKIMLKKSEIIIICVLSVIVFLGITATVTDVILRLISEDELYKENLSTLVKGLLCFSFYTNTERLLKSDKSSDSIKIFHGFKVITILWVILNHTYHYINFSGCSALLEAREKGKEIAFQFIANGFLNVETFFFISAVLVSYGVTKVKERKINIFLYIAR